MTPDELPADMEAIVERLQADLIGQRALGLGDRAVRDDDIRALLKAYQEQRRALKELRAENSTLRAIRPRAYELDRPAEVLRLFRETSGYLKTCQGKCGSDIAGRKHAMTALDAAAADLRAALNQKGDEL